MIANLLRDLFYPLLIVLRDIKRSIFGSRKQ